MRVIACRAYRVLCLLCGVVAAVMAGSCSDDSPSAYGDKTDGCVTIAHLKTLARGLSTTINHDLTIEGYVVANDLFGEYYKSIVLCDGSGGIEISVDCDDTARRFPVAARVVVHCSSLALGDYGGAMVLGAQPTGEYIVDRIAEKDIDRYFVIDRSAAQNIEPQRVTIPQLTPSQINNYVIIEDVTFGSQAGEAWCERDTLTGDYLTTDRVLTDRDGNSIVVRIDSRCLYAFEPVPSGYGSVAAVVDYFDGAYLLRIVNRKVLF